MRLSLRNRLALVFFAITFVAIGALYMYVAPGLQTRLVNEKRKELASSAQHDSAQIIKTVGGSDPISVVRATVEHAALASGARVTLLSVNQAPGGPQLSRIADSSNKLAAPALTFPVAYRTVLAQRMSTGTESARDGLFAEAAIPVFYPGGLGAVIVYSATVSDVVHNVAIVRHEILVAGGIALLLALVGGYLDRKSVV